MATNILINGTSERSVDATDRGLAYGHGVFETIVVNGSEAVAWNEHLQRLKQGLIRLHIPFDAAFEVLLKDELKQLIALQTASSSRQVIKIIVTRGAGGRGYAVTGEVDVNRILISSPYPVYPDNPSLNGISSVFCQTRLAQSSLLAGIKHLNRLEQVLARAEWDDPAIREGLLCDVAGNLIEGTMSNLFWVKDGRLYTPALDLCGVAGVVRSRILKLAADSGIEILIGEYQIEDLMQSDEVFVCNSVIGLWPVISCQIREQTISWNVGSVSRMLQQRLASEGIY